MTVEDCVTAYETLADGVFGHPRYLHIKKPPWIPRDKYDHKTLEKAIKEIVGGNDHLGDREARFPQPCPDMCRT